MNRMSADRTPRASRANSAPFIAGITTSVSSTSIWLFATQHVECLGPAAGFPDVVTKVAQHVHGGGAHRRIVVHHQHGAQHRSRTVVPNTGPISSGKRRRETTGGSHPNRIDIDSATVLAVMRGRRIAARDRKLAGLILLAWSARPIEDVALDQSEYLSHLKGEPNAGDEARLKQLKAEVVEAKKLAPGRTAYPSCLAGRPPGVNVKGYYPAAKQKAWGEPEC